MSKSDKQAQSGFTLIEVLVALTILAVSSGVLFEVFSDSLDRTRYAEAETKATSLAQSLLSDTGVEGRLRDGETTGQFQDGYTWRLRVEPFGTGEDRAAWPVAARDVVATVLWLDGATEKSVTVRTLRLIPKAP